MKKIISRIFGFQNEIFLISKENEKIKKELEEALQRIKKYKMHYMHFIVKKFQEKEISLEQLLSDLGGQLGGSRSLGTERKNSDWDFFFINEEDFNLAVTVLKNVGACFGFNISEPVQIPVGDHCYMNPHKQWRTEYKKKYIDTPGRTTFQGMNIHLILTDNILSTEDALRMHLKNHVGNIPQHVKRIKSWQDFILENKLSFYLNEEQKKEFILWLSDTGKLIELA